MCYSQAVLKSDIKSLIEKVERGQKHIALKTFNEKIRLVLCIDIIC